MKIKYVVIKEKGIVKALPVFDTEYIQGINPVVADILIKKYGVKKSDLALPTRLVGVARLSEADTFDEELGKEIARERLLKGYHKCANVILNKYKEGILKMADYANYRAEKADRESSAATKKLNKLVR